MRKKNKNGREPFAFKSAKILSILTVAGMLLAMTGCSEESTDSSEKSSKQQTTTGKNSEVSETSKEESSQVTVQSADVSETTEEKVLTDSSSETKADTEDTGTDNTHYEDDILTLELPQGAYFDADYLPINIARCNIAPDDEYRELYISFYGEADYDESSPVNFINVASDNGEDLEWFYDESISSAANAADYCYKDYVDTEYVESDTPDYGCVGRYTMDIDGQTAYVVWHMGSAAGSMVNNGPSYEIFVDSLKGTIVEIDYSESLGKGMAQKAESVISTIHFKSN